MKVNIEISDWEAHPYSLRITVRFPQLAWRAQSWWRRNGSGGWGWYGNETDGSLPYDQEDLDAILSTLVDAHPSLHGIAVRYHLDSSAYIVPV